MSSFEMFFGNIRYTGDYDPLRVYNRNEVVKFPDLSLYRCTEDGTVGMAPSGNPGRWGHTLPVPVPTVYGVNTITEPTTGASFGDGEGDIFEWVGEEWRIEQSDTLITLVKVIRNCNCICDCISDCQCYCICVNCVMDYCICADTDPPWGHHLPYCDAFLDCPPQCNCNDCQCTGDCNCTSDNCNAACECTGDARCVCVGLCQCTACQGTLCEGICQCGIGGNCPICGPGVNCS